jgi:Fic family protein
VSLSKYIEATRRKYYRAFEQIEENAKISGVIDVTPFLKYMNEHVYDQLPREFPYRKSIKDYTDLVLEGAVTEKERDLWQFVMSAYGTDEFSTKQLEKDFRDVAYATVRSFVMKFEDEGLLSRQSYGNRNKYRISVD